MALLNASAAYATITPTPNNGAGATALANAMLADPGILAAAGFDTVPPIGTPHGTSDGLSYFPTNGPTFAILTSGDAGLADDPNSSGGSGANIGGNAIRGNTDMDVSILKMDLNVPSGVNCLRFDFAFYSDEFPEFVGSSYNDTLVAELDTSTWTTAGSVISAPDNFAFDPNGDVISINSSGATSMSAANAAGTTYDGATQLLSAATQVTPGAHSLYLSIFDQGDHILDSAAFVDNVVLANVADPTQDCKEGAQPVGLTLTPPSATNPVGTSHTVTATVTDGGVPLANQAVTFAVSGANAGAVGTCVPTNCASDANGHVDFTYAGASAGNDTITACFTPATGSQICATATKTWVGAITISIGDVSVAEGDAGLTPATFTVSLSQPAGPQGVTVQASTANGTATAPSDYAAQSGTTVTFAPGTSTQPFTVQVVGDVVDEGTEEFLVNLSAPTNGGIADGQAVGTITDDDRNGKFSCRASVVKGLGIEPVVANNPDTPCRDAVSTLVGINRSVLGLVTLKTGIPEARTDQTPNDLESTAPAAGDKGTARAVVAGLNIKIGLVSITADVVEATAKVECGSPPNAPTLSSSGTITNLRINGQAVNANTQGDIVVGLIRISLNKVVVGPTSLVRRALTIQGLPLGLADIVVSEAKVGFSGNPCAQ